MELKNKVSGCCKVPWYADKYEDGIRIYCSECQGEVETFIDRPRDKHKLNMYILENAKPNSILFTGEIVDSEKGFNMWGTGKTLKYVLVRRGIKDWCIYCEYLEKNYPNNHIFARGQKVPKEYLKNVVLCDDETFEWANL